MLRQVIATVVCTCAFATPAFADNLTWVMGYPKITALPPLGNFMESRVTGNVGANNTVHFQIRKVGDPLWLEAPAEFNQAAGAYGAYIGPTNGAGVYEIRPIVRNANGVTIFTGITKTVTYP